MPIHNGLLPREGFTADPVLNLIGRTALNPMLLLPVYLLAKFTKKGEDLSILHRKAFNRFKVLFYLALARYLSKKMSEGVTNNWTDDRYVWRREIAVVTGGAGGIGGHIVRLLAERDMHVVVLDIQPMTYDAGPKVHYFKCDITSPADLAEVAKEIQAQIGDPTILVNNAGVARGKTILETTERDLRFTFDVNALAHYHTARAFLPAMVARNHGMVVTVASYAAWMAVPNMVDYAASKAAAQAFHEGLAAELRTRYAAPRVRTVLVNQGYTRTPLFRGYREDASPFWLPALEPESVADAVCRQIFTGRSGHVVAPAAGRTLQLLRALPHWLAYSTRARGQDLMAAWKGRQVVRDLDAHYAEKEAKEKKEVEREGEREADPGESTVLVPGN